jgi:citrate lyase subunit beta/citryl-CoA lyase
MTPIAHRTIAEGVTALFVPGNRADRFAKARQSGADMVILDLEDAVGIEHKDAALAATLAYLGSGSADSSIPALVRTNTIDTERGRQDIAALRDLGGRVDGVVVPKAESVRDLEDLATELPDVPIVAFIETAAGLVALPHLVASGHVSRFAFGAIDFALDVGSTAQAVADSARATIVTSSRAAGLPAPLDSPSPSIDDAARVTEAAVAARAFGFGGMLAIHPRQLDLIRSAFRPSDNELVWARRALEAGTDASQLDGQMIDRPVLERARRLLLAAGETR